MEIPGLLMGVDTIKNLKQADGDIHAGAAFGEFQLCTPSRMLL
ncbi:MAG TPA: hypothetical protein VGC29_10275 [Flavisolibacter sp.]